MNNPKQGLTPAALQALIAGDTLNAVLAMTPGGIEAQEAAGQQVFAISETLPIKGIDPYREKLAALGFVLGPAVDAIFLQATLPPGWKKVPTNHSMWTDLVDEQGRCRAVIFYKAAFYDRSAHIQWTSAVQYGVRLKDGRSVYDLKPDESGVCYGFVTCRGAEVFRTSSRGVTNNAMRYHVHRQVSDEARAYADANYPLHSSDPFAYWEGK